MKLSWVEILFNVFQKIEQKSIEVHEIQCEIEDEEKLKSVLEECKISFEISLVKENIKKIKFILNDENKTFDAARMKINARSDFLDHLLSEANNRTDYIIGFIKFDHINTSYFMEDLQNKGFIFKNGTVEFPVSLDPIGVKDGKYTEIYKQIKAFFIENKGKSNYKSTYFASDGSDECNYFINLLRKEYDVSASWIYNCQYVSLKE